MENKQLVHRSWPEGTLMLIRARSKVTSVFHCVVLVSSRLCLSPLLLKRTQGSSLALIKPKEMPPSCHSINLWNTKKVKINERCVQKVCGYIRWTEAASKRSEDRVALWSMTGGLGIAIYGFYTPTSDRSHLSNQLPWKNQTLHIVQTKCRIQQEQTRKQKSGEVLFLKSEDIKLMWKIK